ncbi:MAG: hypothetical protein AAGF50_02795 [Pseudomonadota bacterium]
MVNHGLSPCLRSLWAQVARFRGRNFAMATLARRVAFVPHKMCAHAMVIVSGLTVLSGCSFNDIGLVDQQLIEADGAFVHQLEAPGLHVNSFDQSFELSIGYYRSLRFYSSGKFSEGTSVSRMFKQISGVYFHMNKSEITFSIGYRERATLFLIDRSGSACGIVNVDINDLRNTVFREFPLDDCIDMFIQGEEQP